MIDITVFVIFDEAYTIHSQINDITCLWRVLFS
ncbi:hypothetical protein QE396_002925 [Enterobacter sp. SORGH_AS 287]|nr:hypothetical protein [Enterobacter sp. SORGH_AS_0287]